MAQCIVAKCFNPYISPLIIANTPTYVHDIPNSPTPPMSSSSSNPTNPRESEDEPTRDYLQECMLLGKFTTSFYNILRTTGGSENYDLENMFVGSIDEYNSICAALRDYNRNHTEDFIIERHPDCIKTTM